MIESSYESITSLMRLVTSLNDQILRMDLMRDSLVNMRDQYQEEIFNMQDKELDKWLTNLR